MSLALLVLDEVQVQDFGEFFPPHHVFAIQRRLTCFLVDRLVHCNNHKRDDETISSNHLHRNRLDRWWAGGVRTVAIVTSKRALQVVIGKAQRI